MTTPNGRPPWKTTHAVRAEIIRRYQLYLDNVPKRIARDFHITPAYVHRIYKESLNAHPATRRAPEKGNSQPLEK